MRRLLLALAVTSLSVGCYNPFAPPPSQPAVGSHQLPIAFQHWIHPGACSAANISMWARYRNTPYNASQEAVIDWAYQWYPWEVGPDGSFGVDAIIAVLYDFAFIWTERNFYVGEADKRQAIADIKKGISVGNPTIVITDAGFHSKLVKGASWQQLANYQPNVDFITTNDPANYGPANDTVGYFLQYVGAGDWSGQFMDLVGAVGQHHSALAELADFDSWGGTYYGDPAPPDGCDECPPLMVGNHRSLLSLAALLFRRPGAAASRSFGTVASAPPRPQGPSREPDAPVRRRLIGPERNARHAVRRQIYVPVPHARHSNDVARNLLAALDQTKLRNVEGWADLDDLLLEGRISMASIDFVESLSRHPQYWLVGLRADERPLARALVSEEGWLLSIMRVPSGPTTVEPRTTEWASGVAEQEGYHSARIRRVHMYNNLTPRSGSAGFDPFFEVTLPGRPALYVSEDGAAYVQDPAGDRLGFWKGGQRRFTRVR